MSDLSDALAEAEKWFEWGITLMVDKRHPIVAAARLVSEAPEWLQRLLEDPPPEPDEVSWCEVHGHRGSTAPTTVLHCMWREWADKEGLSGDTFGPCRMVRRRLLKPEQL